MDRRLVLSLTNALVLAFTLLSSAGFAQEKVEGTVTGTKLTACQFKPGGCEGYLTLETKGGPKPEQVTLKVALGTPIKKGKEDLFLPALRGKLVAVSYVTDKGEKLAKSVEVLEGKR
ncbi:MAG: hypothetical protein A3G24_11770 [Betaproteobacteria bacterium RIFCSPLOWO2_12_FULL_62_13]|nr:MAG: hypothetical protein A3G24_11770 [Betaproteobacteria bacterium RIFCSPLOWO2_12_FULL_62_13]